MSKKLQGNGLWESSRMMLPEHKEEINIYNHEIKRNTRKQLDEQELEQINRALQQSMQHRIPLCIRMYDPFETLEIIGVVESVSALYGRFKVGDDWFIIDDIQSVETEEEPC